MMGWTRTTSCSPPGPPSSTGSTGSTLANTNQSAASSTTSSVNTLSKLYPGQAPNLYPVQSDIQAADTPLPVRFANVDQILAAARSPEEIPPAIQQITDLLRERHRIRAGEPDDFTIRDMTEMTNTLASTTRLMTNLLLCVAMISLVVGGVGHHEHHAGLGHRAHPRDRPAHGRRRAGAATSCGSSWSRPSCCAWSAAALGILLGHGGSRLVRAAAALAGRDLAGGHRRRGPGLGQRRHHLRLLPGLEGVAPGPDRGPALRVRRATLASLQNPWNREGRRRIACLLAAWCLRGSVLRLHGRPELPTAAGGGLRPLGRAGSRPRA